MTALRPIAERLSTTGLPASFDRYIPFCASPIGPIAIVEAGIVDGAIRADAVRRMLAALRRKGRLADRQAAVLERTSLPAKAATALPTALAALRPLGFGNDDRMRALTFTGAALIA